MLIRTIPAGDLAIETTAAGRHFVIARGLRYIRQKLSIEFKFFLGEWFLDRREGVPYYRDVFVWDPKLDVIRSLFRRLVLRTPGVLAIPVFQVQYAPATRTLTFNFQALCTEGVITVTPQDDDFILDVQQAA